MFSYHHKDHIMTIFSSTRCFWLSQPKFILGVQRAFEECLKWLRKLHLSSSVTWCRYQIAATNSYSSFPKDGWTKLYFLFIQPVKSLSIALTNLHWSWYRWVQFPPPLSHLRPVLTHQTMGWCSWRGTDLLQSLQLQSVSLSPLVALTLNFMQGWSPFAAATTQDPHHHPVPAPITLVPFPHSPVTFSWPEKVFKPSHSSAAPGTYS